jgi:hypothetical protein
MPEAIWLLSIGLYPIRRWDATPGIWGCLVSATRAQTGFFLMSESGLHCAMTYRVYSIAWILLKATKYVQTDIELTEHQALREDKVRDDIARRLSCVCGNFSEREFQELVSKMAERQLLDERRQRW